MAGSKHIIAGLDIGTTKVCAVIGEKDENGYLEITGVGTALSTGMRRGVVVNIESTVNAIEKAISSAEFMSGHEVQSCWLSIGGKSIESRLSRGVVAVNGKNREKREISADDIERVLATARAVDFPMDRGILDVIPQYYIVDSQGGIKDPLNMIGVRLEAEVNILTGSRTIGQNLQKCVNQAGFLVSNLILQPLAAGTAVLTEEERNAGIVLIDMGGGKTDALVYNGGSAGLTFSVPTGGNQVTNDISIVKNIAGETAEKLKIEAGCCYEALLDGADEELVAPGVGGSSPVTMLRSQLVQIIEPRIKETLMLVRHRLEDYNVKNIGAGIVLCGGGANMPGLAELAQDVFNMPARIGEPLLSTGLVEEYKNPRFAVPVGLVLEASRREAAGGFRIENEVIPETHGQSPIIKLVNWIRTEFF